MHVVIAGGHGKIGLLLGRLLAEEGHQVRGLIRDPDQASELGEAGVTAVVCDLEDPDAHVEEALGGGIDAVVFAAGSGPGSGDARKQSMDRDGAIRLVEAARAQGVPRFVIVSSIGADSSVTGDGFDAYLRAKGEADDAVRASGLRWTVVRPGQLTDDPGSGRVTIAPSVKGGKVARADVATVLAGILDLPGTAGVTFELVGGQTPIAVALSAL